MDSQPSVPIIDSNPLDLINKQNKKSLFSENLQLENSGNGGEPRAVKEKKKERSKESTRFVSPFRGTSKSSRKFGTK